MSKFTFGSKAQTLDLLHALAERRFQVAPVLYFSVGRWHSERSGVLGQIADRFLPTPIAVRSSSVGEDSADASHAGAYRSRLGIDSRDPDAIAAAVDDVVSSYGGNLDDQVLIQPMVTGVVVSGVIMTRNLDDGSPYYVLSYDDESGRTDSVTGGTGASKTVFVHRGSSDHHLDSPRLRRMVALAREVERIFDDAPLDIEFGFREGGEAYVFQVRPISTAGRWQPDVAQRVNSRLPEVERFVQERSAPRVGLLGRRTILGNMPDWNPAEIIGATPRPLAASLYREILTRRTWSEARALMGYRPLPSEELMVMISGRPYIDVRNSFNSFLPLGLDEASGDRLVDAWLDRLDAHPELHDKVEFEVAFTVRDLCFERDWAARYAGVLAPSELDRFSACLTALTNRCLDLSSGGSLAEAERAIARSAARQQAEPRTALDGAGPAALLARTRQLIDQSMRGGTLPFAVLARHGFIAEALLRSAIGRGALAPERATAFRRSVKTVLSLLTEDMQAVIAGRMATAAFMDRYGHLRPGTYDVLSQRYADRQDLFADVVTSAEDVATPRFEPSAAELRALSALLAESGITAVDGARFFDYARRAIAGREYAKFVFTRDLSDAIEALLAWGRVFDIDRSALSYLTFDLICDTLYAPVLEEPRAYFAEIVAIERERLNLAHAMKMSYLIRGVRDLHVIPVHRAAPNFITKGRADGPIAIVSAVSTVGVALQGKIVLIEHADPGFDWIFAKGISGLITKYGGANSHMAIRCAEMGLPAAIGCGEYLFDSLSRARAVELNCAENVARPAHVH